MAATLNEIFGLATPEQPKPPPVKEPAPPPVKEPAPPPEDGIDPNLEFVLRPAGPEDFHRSWEEFRTRWQPLFKAGAWNEDEQRLLVQKASDGGHLHHVLVDGDLAGWVEYVVVDGKDPVVGHLCLDLAFAVHVLKRFCAEAQAEDRQLHVAVKANFYPLLTALTAEGFEVTSDDLDTHLTLSYFDDSEIA